MLQRLQEAKSKLAEIAAQTARETEGMGLWLARAEFAGRLEDNLAMEKIAEHFDRKPPVEIQKTMAEQIALADDLQKQGFDSSVMRKNSQALADQVQTNYLLNLVLALRVDGALGFYSKVLREGEKLLPQIRDPDDRLILETGMVSAAFRSGRPELAARYLKDLRLDTPGDRFFFGVQRLRFDVDQNPDFSAAQFVARFNELWPLWPQIPLEKLSRPHVQSAAHLLWLSSRMLRRLSVDDPLRASVAAVGSSVSQDLETRGRAAWTLPVASGGKLNPAWNDWMVFELQLARLSMATDAREAGEPAEARAQLAKVAAFLPEMDKVLPSLETVGRPLFADSGIVLDLRRGFFSNIPALYEEEVGRLAAADGKPAAVHLKHALDLYTQAGGSSESIRLLTPTYAVVAQREGMPFDQAATLIKASLKSSVEADSVRGQYEAYLALGTVEAAGGQKQAAIEDLQHGITLQESLSAQLGAPTSGSAYELLARLQTEGGHPEQALQTLDRRQQAQASKATPVATNPRVEQALLAVRDSRSRLRSLETEGVHLRSAAPSSSDLAAHSELLASTKAEFYQRMGELYRLNPEFEKLAIRPINFARMQKTIPADTLVVQYFPTATSLYLFVLDANTLKTRRVTVPAARLDELGAAMRASILSRIKGITDLSEFNKASYALHAALVEPLAEDLKGKHVLAIIPTGSLLYVPFAALAHAEGGRPHFLVEDLETVSLVKSSDLEMLNAPAAGSGSGRLVAFGDPDGSLASALAEVRDISKLFGNALIYLREKASKLALAGLAKENVSYLHFATHGILDNRDPQGNHLVMAGGNLSVNEIAGLDLGKEVRLVTLSACQTALNEARPRSELLQSLADAFGYAGSPSVVASLWSVADDSTREFMAEFYHQLHTGAPRGRALQQATLKVSHDSRYAHPFFWAPFILMGDWR